MASSNLSLQSGRSRAESSRPESLVARGYGRRDYYLRRLLAITDVGSLALAMVVAIGILAGARRHPWEEYLLYALITLPAWVVLFKVYGLYERDTKRLRHSTLDDLPSLFHALLLGGLLTWCWFLVVAPAKLVFTAVLAFGALALVLVPAGRALARASFLRLVSPERVLLIGTGRTSGALIDKIRAKKNLRLEPIGIVGCNGDGGKAVGLPRLGYLEEVDLQSLMTEHRIGRVVVADAEVEGERLLGVLRDCKTVSVKVSLLPSTFSALGPSVEVDDLQGV